MLYAKVLSLNCEDLEYENCNFSTRNMNSRDRGEKLTKEGAARVCMYKLCNIIHSYTLECGLHYTTIRKPPAQETEETKLSPEKTPLASSSNEPKSPIKSFANSRTSPVGQRGTSLVSSQTLSNSPVKKPIEPAVVSEKESVPVKYYSIESYENLGQALMVSLLDIFEKNPQSLVPKLFPGGISELRKQIAGSLNRIFRFRNEGKLKAKIQQIDKMIKATFYDEFEKKKVFESMLLKTSQGDPLNEGMRTLNKKTEHRESCKSLPEINSGDESQRQEQPKIILGSAVRRGRQMADFENRTSDEEDPALQDAEEGCYTNESSEERSLSKRLARSRVHYRGDSEKTPIIVHDSTPKDRFRGMYIQSIRASIQMTTPKVLSRQKGRTALFPEPNAPQNKGLSVDFHGEKPPSIALDSSQHNDYISMSELKKL